jgi:hypothetical protein
MSEHIVNGAARTGNLDESLTEQWRPVIGFGGYEVSDLGRIRRHCRSAKHRGRIIYRKWCFNTSGYVHVGLGRDGKTITRPVHHLVAEAFLGSRPPGKQINHKNGEKGDPRLSNLEYVTPSGNTQHAYDTGLIKHPRGQDWYSAKLTDSDVREIREFASLGVPQKDIAARYRISRSVACEIINRKAWTHVA